MSDLSGKSILITGGTGTIGQGLTDFIVHQAPSHWPKKLILLSQDEYKQYESQKRFPRQKLPFIHYILADVADYYAILDSLIGVDMVIHTAALKRIEAGEVNPEAFLKTNVWGTTNVLRAAKIQRVSRVLTISTDKAVYPTTMYGATKLCAEKITVQKNDLDMLKASVVRLGNIFGSRGSIVDELSENTPTKEITITHPDMTRYTTSIAQAASYIFEVAETAIGGEVFVPKMKAYRLTDLISVVLPDTKVSYASPRYTEKLHESLFSTEEARFALERETDYVISSEESVQKFYHTNFNASKISAKKNNSEQCTFLTIDELTALLNSYS